MILKLGFQFENILMSKQFVSWMFGCLQQEANTTKHKVVLCVTTQTQYFPRLNNWLVGQVSPV